MATHPRIVVDIVNDNQDPLSEQILDATVRQEVKGFGFPILYGKVENIYGINADWFSILIRTGVAKYRVQDPEKKTGEGMYLDEYIAKYSESIRLKIKIGFYPDYVERIHGYIHEISYVTGSGGRMMKVSGGDICYHFNKIYVGDYMLQLDANARKWQDPKSKEYAFADKSRIYILQKILGLRKKEEMAVLIGKNQLQSFGTSTTTNPSYSKLDLSSPYKSQQISNPLLGGDPYVEYQGTGFRVLVAKTATVNEPLYGETKAIKNELANPNAAKYYQINNQTLLEVLDDICFRSGWVATVMKPGTIISNVPVILITDVWKKRKPNVSIKTIAPSIIDEEESWVKFTKMTHFDDGLKIGINYWDWQYAVTHNTTIDNQVKNCRRGKAQWFGNNKPDVAIQAYIDYENVNVEAANRRAYMAINRLVTQRITVSGGLTPDPTLFPGDEVTFKDYGPFSDQYMITAVTCNVGQKGFSMQFSARLPDLIVCENEASINKDNEYDRFKKVLCGKYAQKED